MMKKIFLILIILLAFFLRFFKLADAPKRLTHDEMSIGYNALSTFMTGKDEWGRAWPLDFEAFGDHKLPGYIYTVFLFLTVLPLGVLSLKLPSILAGVVIVLCVYLISSKITKNKNLGLLASLLVAISPWPIHLSRMAFESNLALAFFSLGFYFLLKFFDKKHKKILLGVIVGLFFSLSIYTYIAFRLILFLFFIILFFLITKYELDLTKYFIVLISFAIFSLPILSQILGSSGTARLSHVGVFSHNDFNAILAEQHDYCFMASPTLSKVCRRVFNEPALLVSRVFKNYISFLMPSFLFLQGDSLEYLNNPNFGEIYLWLLPFYLIGIYYWFKQKGFGADLFKLGFLLSPIPSALAGEPQIVRGSALLIFVFIIIASGIVVVSKKFNKNIFYLIIFAGLLFSSTRYFLDYIYIYSPKYENYFYSLPPEAVSFITSKQDQYKIIYLDRSFTDAHIAFAFFNQINPVLYQKNVVRPDPDGFGFSHPTTLGRYQFGNKNLQNFLCHGDENVLFITNLSQVVPTWSFKGFSGVHTQVEIFDIKETRERYKKQETWKVCCPEG